VFGGDETARGVAGDEGPERRVLGGAGSARGVPAGTAHQRAPRRRPPLSRDPPRPS